MRYTLLYIDNVAKILTKNVGKRRFVRGERNQLCQALCHATAIASSTCHLFDILLKCLLEGDVGDGIYAWGMPFGSTTGSICPNAETVVEVGDFKMEL